MKSEYRKDSHQLLIRLAREGELIARMADLIVNTRMAGKELFDYLDRMTLETVL